MGRSGLQAPPGFRDSATAPLAPGEVIASTYMIKHEIARTDTGLVYEARDMLLDRPVAFKLAWRDPGMPSLLHEARRCAAVHDPCAVAVYGMGTHHGIEYVVAERVTGQLLRDLVGTTNFDDHYTTRLRKLVAAIVCAHDAGIAIGDISGSTVLVDDAGRMVLGRLSMSQVPAFGPLGQILAPEVVNGEVKASDPIAAEAIDLYGIGCVAIELARGSPPFAGGSREAELEGHARRPPPRLVDVRPDLPQELSDLVEWLLAKQPAIRPSSARDVLAQLDAVIERHGDKARAIRILIVDDDVPNARILWSLARRANAHAIVEIASEGTDAAHKLNRDLPELVLIDAGLRGVMNALELSMYARGLDRDQAHLVILGDINERERPLFAAADAQLITAGPRMADEILELIRATAAQPTRRRKRSTVSG